MIKDNEIALIADYFGKNIQTIQPLGDGYYYNHLSLCVIEAVWSIGVRFASVLKVIKNYCDKKDIIPYRENYLRERSLLPEKAQQIDTISSFLDYAENFTSDEQLANELFKKRQRTSSRNGILKAKAVFDFAKVLKKYHVEYFQDIVHVENNLSFEKDIKNIPGQKSGISLDYFFMLAGDENRIKSDRMIKRFLATAIKRSPDTISNSDAQNIMEQLLKKINDNRIKSVRHLDNLIWEYESKKGKKDASN